MCDSVYKYSKQDQLVDKKCLRQPNPLIGEKLEKPFDRSLKLRKSQKRRPRRPPRQY
jgi:hypothetical protein